MNLQHAARYQECLDGGMSRVSTRTRVEKIYEP